MNPKELYYYHHSICPNCHGTDFYETYVGYIFDYSDPQSFKDLNSVECSKCKWTGTIHDRISPMKLIDKPREII